MTKLESIVVSNTEPNSKNVLWYDNKRLLIFSNGHWSPVVDLDDIDVDNVSNLQEALKSLNIKVDNKVDKVELDKALTAKQDKLVNSDDVTIGIDSKLTVTDLAKKKEFIDQCKAEGAVYNSVTGYFELNGLTDITTEQMRQIMPYLVLGRATGSIDYCFQKARIRTITIYSEGDVYNPKAMDWAFYGATVETIAFKNLTHSYVVPSSMGFMLRACHWLHTVYGAINMRGISSGTIDIAMGAEKLKNIQLMSLRTSITFAGNPLLSLESITYMVENAINTDPITITLHPDAYARLTDEIITAATAKQINFATETA